MDDAVHGASRCLLHPVPPARSRPEVLEDVHGGDDADEDARGIDHEQAMDMQGEHLLDDLGGGSIRGNGEEGGSHDVADGGGVDVLHLESFDRLALARLEVLLVEVGRAGGQVVDLFPVVFEQVVAAEDADGVARLVDDRGVL